MLANSHDSRFGWRLVGLGHDGCAMRGRLSGCGGWRDPRKRPAEKSPAWRRALLQEHGADAQNVMTTGNYPFILFADYTGERGYSRRANKARRENPRPWRSSASSADESFDKSSHETKGWLT